MTQEFLATMLGVRRVGITVTGSALQRNGLSSHRRGALTVLNRKGLQAVSCSSCYNTGRQTYTSILGD